MIIRKYNEQMGAYLAKLAQSKPHTNADRIRAMTDEELAYTFAHKVDACWNCSTDGLDTCKECWLEWMKQEIVKE